MLCFDHQLNRKKEKNQYQINVYTWKNNQNVLIIYRKFHLYIIMCVNEIMEYFCNFTLKIF